MKLTIQNQELHKQLLLLLKVDISNIINVEVLQNPITDSIYF